MRVGMGYDVHKLTEGRKLILGGVDAGDGDACGVAVGIAVDADFGGALARYLGAHHLGDGTAGVGVDIEGVAGDFFDLGLAAVHLHQLEHARQAGVELELVEVLAVLGHIQMAFSGGCTNPWQGTVARRTGVQRGGPVPL
mgnify:CR=1 FL=1